MSEISELILLLNKQHQEQMAVLRGEHQEQINASRAAENFTKQLEQPARKCSNTDGKFSTIRFHI